MMVPDLGFLELYDNTAVSTVNDALCSNCRFRSYGTPCFLVEDVVSTERLHHIGTAGRLPVARAWVSTSDVVP